MHPDQVVADEVVPVPLDSIVLVPVTGLALLLLLARDPMLAGVGGVGVRSPRFLPSDAGLLELFWINGGRSLPSL